MFLELYFTIFQTRESTKNCSLRIVCSQFLFNNYTCLKYIYFVTYNGQNVSAFLPLLPIKSSQK